MADLFRTTPERAVAVYAHPDDAEVSCGGTLAKWAAAGSEVMLVVCMQGDKGSMDMSVSRDALAERRRGEVAKAMQALGVAEHVLLGIPDGEIENGADVREQLVRVIRRCRPEVLVCPDPSALFFGGQYYNHRDHRTVGIAALDAAYPDAALPHYFPEAGPSHLVREALLSGTLEADVWVDIVDTLEAKVAAVACHESQVREPGEWLGPVLRDRAEQEGRRAGVAVAEAFRRVLLA